MELHAARSRHGSSPAALLAAAALLGGMACGLACSTAPQRPPSEFSVVLLTLDTTRADRIGAFGGTSVPTPHLDRAAAEGVKFLQAISQAPLTLPAHGSILTGRYPASHGARHNGVYKLPDAEESLAERLAAEGFRTAAFVGAFVLNSGFGTDQGFATYDDIETFRYEGGRDNLYESRRSAEEVNAAAFRWLDEREPGRFFLWLHYYDPHHPYVAPERPGLAGRDYERCISYVDAAFGDLVARLERDGLLDDTLLVVVGDHGESLGEHREKTHGIFLYEGAVRVPFFVRAPGLVRAGSAVDSPVELVDVAPTILDLLDLPPLERAEGASLVPRIEGREADEVAYAETLMPRIEFGWSELRMARDDRYKYIAAPQPELYDLRDDPGERTNLVALEPELAADMAALVADWTARTASADSAQHAQRGLSAEEREKLQSLGYLGSLAQETGAGAELPDPKDRIDEGMLIYESRERLAAGDVLGALRAFDAILHENPGNHLARNSKIQALMRLERLEEAEAEAIAAVELATRDEVDSTALLDRARRTLASIYWMRGNNAAAEEQYRLAIELNARSDLAAPFGGLLLGAAGGVEDAMRIVRGVLERNPNDGMAVAAKFELELSQGEREAALETARRLAELAAGDWDTQAKAGKLAREFREPQLAARLFRLAAERRPDDPDVLGHLGTALLGAGELDEARATLVKVERLRPEDPRTQFYLGNIALLQNDEAEARRRMDACLAIEPDFVEARLNLARWLGDRGRLGEAERVVEETLARHPDNEQARDLLRQLQALAARGVGAPAG